MEQIEAAYRRFASAFEKRDMSGIADVLRDDFAWTLVSGESLDREASLREIKTFLTGAVGELRFIATLDEVNGDGPDVQVSATEEVWAGDARLTLEKVLEQWVAEDGRWKLAKTLVLSSE